jgi:hypothetical protein
MLFAGSVTGPGRRLDGVHVRMGSGPVVADAGSPVTRHTRQIADMWAEAVLPSFVARHLGYTGAV